MSRYSPKHLAAVRHSQWLAKQRRRRTNVIALASRRVSRRKAKGK